MPDERTIQDLLKLIPVGLKLNLVPPGSMTGRVDVVPVGEISRLALIELDRLTEDNTRLNKLVAGAFHGNPDLTVRDLLTAAKLAEDRINQDIQGK